MAAISMSKRTIALIVSIILAAVAAIAIYTYVQNADERAAEDFVTVQAYRTKEFIPANTSVADAEGRGLFELADIAQGALPEGYVTSLEQISGRIAAVNIPANTPLTISFFVERGTAGTTLSVPQGRHAMTVEVDIPAGVANLPNVGDHVSVLAQLTVAGGPGAAQETRVQFLVQDVEVIFRGHRAFGEQGPGTVQPTDKVELTLAVTPRDAERLAFGIFSGQLYLTLLPEGGGRSSTPGRTSRNVF